MKELIKKRKKKGFTLVELIVVIAIIGILAAIAVPKYISKLNDAKRSSAISEATEIVMAVKYYNAEEDDENQWIKSTDQYSSFKSKIEDTYINTNSIIYIKDNMTYDKLNDIKTGKQKIEIQHNQIVYIN